MIIDEKKFRVSSFIGVHLICVKYSACKTDNYLISNFFAFQTTWFFLPWFILNVDWAPGLQCPIDETTQ